MKRHVGHMVMVSLKYFFDIDYSLCYHSFITFIVAASIIKLSFGRIQTALFDGLLTIKQDILAIKDQFNAYKERWSM